MCFNRFLHLIAFSGKAHRGSPASGRLTTKMRDAGAPSQAKRTPDFGRYLPLSAPTVGSRRYFRVGIQLPGARKPRLQAKTCKENRKYQEHQESTRSHSSIETGTGKCRGTEGLQEAEENATHTRGTERMRPCACRREQKTPQSTGVVQRLSQPSDCRPISLFILRREKPPTTLTARGDVEYLGRLSPSP